MNMGYKPSVDGVPVCEATTVKLDSYVVGKQQLDGLSVPILFNASNPHERIFFAFMDGTENDAINNPAQMTNVGRLYFAVSNLSANNTNIGAYYEPGVGTQEYWGRWGRF
jgi:uncharacterized protein (DUF2235 family)